MMNSSSRSKLFVGMAIALAAAIAVLVLDALGYHRALLLAAAIAVVTSAFSLLLLMRECRRATNIPLAPVRDSAAKMMEPDDEWAAVAMADPTPETCGVTEPAVSSVPVGAVDHAEVLAKITQVCGEISKGNFEVRLINIEGIGEDASAQYAVNDMIDRCDAFVREASAAMDAVRHHKYYRRILREGLNGMLDNAAGSINEATAAIQKRAAAFDAAGVDIRRGVDRSTQIARQAVARADEANRTIQDLSSAAERIGKSVSLIGTIASQTNLLALNAAIEAAHAGESGKGFAVVAQEVKSLSNQTAVATKEISDYMKRVLTTTKEAVEAIKVIGDIVNEIDQSTSMAMTAVLSQVAANDEFAQAG